jgi:thiol:disulfide interchange protein DsbC
MDKVITVLAALALAGAGTLAVASEAAVKAAIQKKIPQFPVESVTRTPLPGIYEAFGDGQIIYVDEAANYVLQGNLLSIEKNANVTQDRLSRLTAVKFDQLPLNLALKRVKGKGTRRLAYFGDPNCGYCKKFEQDLLKIEDVTIYTFVLPVLGPDSVEKSKSIWCSKDRNKAWNDQLVNGIAPTAPTTCDTKPIERTVEFAQQKKINGTPTMFFVDGQRVPGAIPVEQIEQMLAAAARAK